MKLPIIALLSLMLFTSCAKDSDEFMSDPSESQQKAAAMEWGPMTCTLPDGSCGSKCGNNATSCTEQTECKKNEDKSQRILNELFTPEEQEELAHQNALITNQRLLDALKEDGTLPIR